MSLETIYIGNISFSTYGMLIGLAIVTGIWVAEQVVSRYYKDSYIDKLDVEKSALWMVVFGILGARAYHVIDYWDYYLTRPNHIIMVWNGGLGIYGAIAGGLLGAYLYVKLFLRRKKSKKKQMEVYYGLMDVVSVGLPLSQAIGRIGNYINQELYGAPTSLPWGIYISANKRLSGYEGFDYFHPLFIYEGVWNLLGFMFLFVLIKNNTLKKSRGNYFLLYLLWYGIGRSILEPMRIRYWNVAGVPVASMIGIGIIIIATMAIYYRKKKGEWKILVD